MTTRTDATGPNRGGAAPRVARWQVGATLSAALLAVAATGLGLFRSGFYRDPEALRVQAYGQDAVTLVVVVPLLLVGLALATRGSLRGYLLWLGALGYLLYTYAVYAVITTFNPFFLGYVALFGLSLFAFVGGLLRVDPDAVHDRLASLPVRVLSVGFAAMGTLVALLWLSEVVPATLADTRPESLVDTGLPANVVHVLDLGVLVPAVVLTAVWLRRDRPWASVFAGVLLVKLTTIGLAVLAMVAWMTAAGDAPPVVQVVVFGVVTLANVGLAAVYFRSFRAGDRDPAPSTAPAGRPN